MSRTRSGGATALVAVAFAALVAAAAAWPFGEASGAHKKVLLKDVGALTLRRGAMSTGRRSAPVPQIACVGGDCHAFQPEVIQCRNVGSDGIDAQWKCEADGMPSHVKFGQIDVICEGYDYPDDPYILVRSRSRASGAALRR